MSARTGAHSDNRVLMYIFLYQEYKNSKKVCGGLAGRYTALAVDEQRVVDINTLWKTRALSFLYSCVGKIPVTLLKPIVSVTRCASGCVVECRICNREVAGSNLGLGYFAPRSTQPSIPSGSVNEYQLRLGRQRQAWLIPLADEMQCVQVKLLSLDNACYT